MALPCNAIVPSEAPIAFIGSGIACEDPWILAAAAAAPGVRKSSHENPPALMLDPALGVNVVEGWWTNWGTSWLEAELL